jgi:hypothetical protein
VIEHRHRDGGASGAAVRVSGRVLAAAFSAAGRLRPDSKPLHPRGAVTSATLRRFGLADGCGVPWLDEPGVDSVLVRLSRSLGLPAPWPDVLGLAVRVPMAEGGHADLLMSSTGTGALSRFLLVPARRPGAATYSTLLPYRAPTGAVLLAATPAPGPDALRFDLRLAPPRGRWRVFANLQVRAADACDEDIAFDPMTNTVPGLRPYDWVRQLRAGSYRAARHARGDQRVRP